MPMGLQDSQRFVNAARRGSSRCGIVTLLKLDEFVQCHVECAKIISSYSVKSMISKPFEQRIAIFALRKIKSYDSDGKKKSYR